MKRRSSLPVEFYERPVEQVARDLLGAIFRAETGRQLIRGTIVETEAYGGSDDLASHAAFRKTGLVQYMFGPPGTLYVYNAYGMYPCLNIVTGPEGEPAAVLVRAVSIELPDLDNRSASGPGRLGRAVGLTTDHNGQRVTGPPFWIESSNLRSFPVAAGPRVGVKRGDHRHWRFAISGHPAVSRPRL